MSSAIEKAMRKNTTESMENVELHRANSMVDQPPELSKENQTSPDSSNTVHFYVSSRAVACFFAVKDLKVELVMFLYMFSVVMRQVSNTSIIMDKVCLVHLGYSKDVCNDLANNPESKIEVEKLANNYSVAHAMIQMLPSAVLACFIGAWSDKYSRKVPVIAALVGIIIDGLGTTLCASFLYSRADYLLVPAVFTGFSGGFIAVLTVLYSYAGDTTVPSKRTMKYAFLEVAFGLSMPLGQLAGGWLFQFTGYLPVFIVSTGGHVFCLAFVMFALKETKGLDNKDSWRVRLKNLFSFKPVMESFRATIKRRPNRGREQILMIMFGMSFSVLSLASGGSISFLYAHHVYNWGNTKYSTVSAVFSVMGTVVLLITVPIFKRLQLGDAALGILGTASLLAKNLGMGLATKVEVYFLAHLLGLFGGLGNLGGRSRISKVTSEDDLGKVFAFLSTAESLLPIMAAAVIAQVFNATLNVYPGIVYLGLGFLLIVPLAVYIWLSRLPVAKYEEMQNPPQHVEVESTIHNTNKGDGQISKY